MSLYSEWEEIASNADNTFWTRYFEQEKEIYKLILGKKIEIISGKVGEAAKTFKMDLKEFIGFLDGINTSLKTSLSLKDLEEETEISAEIDFEKLYYNMIDMKADWLYSLEEWDNILTIERRTEIKKEYNKDKTAVSNKVGRNEPCICGSGKKYKKCCYGKE